MSVRPARSSLLLRILVLLLLSGAGLLAALTLTPAEGVAAQDAVCVETKPATRTCRIDQPRVTQRLTDYPAIRLQPGDLITVAAGGCVRTGPFVAAGMLIRPK